MKLPIATVNNHQSYRFQRGILLRQSQRLLFLAIEQPGLLGEAVIEIVAHVGTGLLPRLVFVDELAEIVIDRRDAVDIAGMVEIDGGLGQFVAV